MRQLRSRGLLRAAADAARHPDAVIVAYIDGGSRGNPGPAGYGVRIETAEGHLVEEFAGAIGVATNNVAEYRGLMAALTWAVDRGHRNLLVRSDSLLLVMQMLVGAHRRGTGSARCHRVPGRRANGVHVPR